MISWVNGFWPKMLELLAFDATVAKSEAFERAQAERVLCLRLLLPLSLHLNCQLSLLLPSLRVVQRYLLPHPGLSHESFQLLTVSAVIVQVTWPVSLLAWLELLSAGLVGRKDTFS